jgi:NAD-dependent deacetylase
MTDGLGHAVEVLGRAEGVLVFTGAGISTESGIPDFRGPDGLWTKVDPDDFTIGRFLSDPELRRRSWRMYLEGGLRGITGAEPNPAHHAVVDLWRSGRWAGCVTQNIDSLHQAAGLPDEEVAELHGHLRSARCAECGATWPLEKIVERVRAGDEDPHCSRCGGIVKTATVMFGELLPPEPMQRAYRMAANADAVLAVGSTLSVYPAANIAVETAQRGAPLVIVNLGPTDHDTLAVVKVEGPAGQVLPEIIQRLATV